MVKAYDMEVVRDKFAVVEAVVGMMIVVGKFLLDTWMFLDFAYNWQIEDFIDLLENNLAERIYFGNE